MLNEIDVVLHAMREAGAAILHLQQQRDLNIVEKSNGDIVTQADLLANDILKSHLLKHFPNDGWLSEESKDDTKRLAHDRVWIVDPIDGTKEFANGIPEYAISVALIDKKIPVAACVFNPATDELFYAIKDQGAWLGNKKLYCSVVSEQDMLILASRSEYERGEWSQFEHYYQVKPMGSIAYKLAFIAAGYAQATFTLNVRNEWDIAAGVLLVTEAGGVVTNKYREKILFNNENTKVTGIIASSADVNDRIFELIKKV